MQRDKKNILNNLSERQKEKEERDKQTDRHKDGKRKNSMRKVKIK